jgi:CRP/FNR family transcriptional regulator
MKTINDTVTPSAPAMPPIPANGARTQGGPAKAARCTASDVLRWSGLSDWATEQTDRMPFAMRRIRADVPLLHEGMPFEHLYFVCAGSLKVVQVDSEGYEQVLGFALHGDTVGLDGMSRGRHASGAVALEDSTVAIMPYRELVSGSHRFEAIERLMQKAIGAELLRRSDTQYLMSAASSEVRVARFLLHFAQRQNAMGYSDRRIRLRMTRRDIASHLGVAHETVSRALTTLSQCGCIGVTYRDIEILDASRLHEIQRVTRGTWRGLLDGRRNGSGNGLGNGLGNGHALGDGVGSARTALEGAQQAAA